MSYSVADLAEIEPVMGGLYRVRRALDLQAFGVNLAKLPPHFEHYPEHDERSSGQEEVFFCVEGDGTLTVDGEEIEFRPGRFVRVAPSATRKLTPGPHGCVALAIGGRADGAYSPSPNL